MAERFNPEQFFDQRQRILYERLHQEVLPCGAKELIEEALEEYELLGRNLRSDETHEEVVTDFSLVVPSRGDTDILPSGIHRITTQFIGTEPAIPAEPVRAVSVFVRHPCNDQIPIYPDSVRHIGIDSYGNSRPADFLFAIPENLIGSSVTIEAYVLFGPSVVVKNALEVQIR